MEGVGDERVVVAGGLLPVQLAEVLVAEVAVLPEPRSHEHGGHEGGAEHGQEDGDPDGLEREKYQKNN